MAHLTVNGGAKEELPSFKAGDTALSRGEGKGYKRKRKKGGPIAPEDEPGYTQKVAKINKGKALLKQEELNDLHVQKIKEAAKDC
jgi:hypothetical protein